MRKAHTTNGCAGRWLATADEDGWLNIFALESLATRTTATSDHAAARQRPNALGGINALSFDHLTVRDDRGAISSSHRQGELGKQRSGAHELVCDTGCVCCVFNVTPRIATPKQSLGELHLH